MINLKISVYLFQVEKKYQIKFPDGIGTTVRILEA